MRYLAQPFAVSGDKVEIPTDAQPTGAVSLVQGYGPDYSKDPETDTTAKRIERLAFNGLMFDVTDALIQWQRGVFPEWAANVAYQQNAIVKSGANTYVSLKAANTDILTVTASWRRVVLGAASATLPGFLRLATNAEAAAGAVTDAAVTPAGLAAALAASTAVVPATRRVLAGNGLTGGGALGADVTVSMGAPGTLTGSSPNAATAESHTHVVNLGVADVAGAAPLASPALSGSPTAPTQAAGNNTTRIATTAFVAAAVSAATSGLGALASLNSVNDAQWSGTPLAVANGGTGSTTPAAALLALGAAPLASPILTGAPRAPTPVPGSNTTVIATTAFVTAAVVAAIGGLGALASLNSVNNSNWSGAALAVANGGTGATTAAAGLLALGGASRLQQVIAGLGLTGGGNIAADRTLNLGTPTSITAASANTSFETTHSHALTMATAAQYRANSSANPLGPDQVWASAAYVALAQAATIAVNMGAGFNFSTTMTGNRVLGNPTNATPGQSGIIVLTQDATGTRTLTYGSSWKFQGGIAPVLATGSGVVNVLAYTVVSTTQIIANLLRAVS